MARFVIKRKIFTHRFNGQIFCELEKIISPILKNKTKEFLELKFKKNEAFKLIYNGVIKLKSSL